MRPRRGSGGRGRQQGRGQPGSRRRRCAEPRPDRRAVVDDQEDLAAAEVGYELEQEEVEGVAVEDVGEREQPLRVQRDRAEHVRGLAFTSRRDARLHADA